MSIKNHQISKLIEDRKWYESYSAKPRSTKPFFIRAQDVCGRLDIDLDRIQKNTYYQNPPWMMRRIFCDQSLLDLPKGIHQEVIRSNFTELNSNKYDGYIPVFTAGSCIDGRTGCSVFLPNEVAKYRLLDDASILYCRTLCIQESTLHDFVIYSDSLSSLESIEQLYPTRHPLLNQIQDVNHNLAVDKNIAFVWVTGHSNIQGNETADKAATNLQMPSDLKTNTCELKSKIKKESLATWQNQWEQTTSHMLNIKRTTKRWESTKVFNRRAHVVITRMRIGHTHLTHSKHMNHLKPIRCDNCDTTLTVKRAKYILHVVPQGGDVVKIYFMS
jgi:hypothetical protein